MDYIRISEHSDIPKYRQIIQSVHMAIRSGQLKRGDKMPSLNAVKSSFNLSRDTVLSAFKEMQANKLIVSTPGKGYYVASTKVEHEEKIFLLFDELNAFKEDLYTAFLAEVGKKATVEIYFHHFNPRVFKQLIEENRDNYSSFVVMPGSLTRLESVLKKLPSNNTYILDRNNTIEGNYGRVIQNFDMDIYAAMHEGKSLLQKYKKLVLVYSEVKEPRERVLGFVRFCKENTLPYEVLTNLNTNTVQPGEAWFIANDRHLVNLIQYTELNHLQIGKDVGIVSFNDTMLKQVVAGGITTISTDFAQMGKRMAQMVMNHENECVENPSKLIVRKSL